MAEKLKEFDWRQYGHTRYDWDKLFDGSIWKLKEGEDFQSTTKNFRSLALTTANKRHIKLHTAVQEPYVILQKITNEG